MHERHHHREHEDLHGRKLLAVTLLNFIITIAEIIGGLLSNSLSLLSDAVHNLGDAMALFFAFIASKVGNRKADLRRTFGYKRVEILTAFFNALMLILICFFLVREAYFRLLNPEPIKGFLMLAVAIIGLLANWISVVILQKDRDKNINVKAAYLHLLGDTLSSVAVIIGGICIIFFDQTWIDPVITMVVAIYIVYHTWSVLVEAIDILMQSAPKDIDIRVIIKEIEDIPEVDDVHHLHLWRLNEDQIHFEAHVNIPHNIDLQKAMEVKQRIAGILEAHDIFHNTLQLEYKSGCQCNALIVNENH